MDCGRIDYRQTNMETGRQVSITTIVPVREDGHWTLAMMVKTTKSGFVLAVVSTGPASGMNIRERQEARMNPKFLT